MNQTQVILWIFYFQLLGLDYYLEEEEGKKKKNPTLQW